LNPDTVVAEDTFQKLLGFSDTKKNLGIVGCRLIDGTGQFLPESKRNIPLPKVALQKMLGNPKAYYASHLAENEIGEVSIFVGAFMLMKKEVYQKIDGFDEDYFMYGEDIDISYKILKAGYKNYYYGSTTIIHYKGESTLKDANYAKRFHGAMQIFYKKHFKTNVLFNSLVWFGIKLAYILRSEPKIAPSKIEFYALMFSQLPVKFASSLIKPIELNPDLKQVKNNTEIIFDANALSYKQIIECISDKKINNKATFKIRPNNSNFIIGSDSSKSRGDVITF
jgi:GT2 family glycosyltransferase